MKPGVRWLSVDTCAESKNGTRLRTSVYRKITIGYRFTVGLNICKTKANMEALLIKAYLVVTQLNLFALILTGTMNTVSYGITLRGNFLISIK